MSDTNNMEDSMQSLVHEFEAVVESLKTLGMLPEKAEFWSVERVQWSDRYDNNTAWRVVIGYGQECFSEEGSAPLANLYRALAKLMEMYANIPNDGTQGEI